MNPATLLASPVDQRIYKTLLGLDNIDVFDRWIQTHQLVPIAKPDLVYLQVRKKKELIWEQQIIFPIGTMLIFNSRPHRYKRMAYTVL